MFIVTLLTFQQKFSVYKGQYIFPDLCPWDLKAKIPPSSDTTTTEYW